MRMVAATRGRVATIRSLYPLAASLRKVPKSLRAPRAASPSLCIAPAFPSYLHYAPLLAQSTPPLRSGVLRFASALRVTALDRYANWQIRGKGYLLILTNHAPAASPSATMEAFISADSPFIRDSKIKGKTRELYSSKLRCRRDRLDRKMLRPARPGRYQIKHSARVSPRLTIPPDHDTRASTYPAPLPGPGPGDDPEAFVTRLGNLPVASPQPTMRRRAILYEIKCRSAHGYRAESLALVGQSREVQIPALVRSWIFRTCKTKAQSFQIGLLRFLLEVCRTARASSIRKLSSNPLSIASGNFQRGHDRKKT
jgi:hypothetical protein